MKNVLRPALIVLCFVATGYSQTKPGFYEQNLRNAMEYNCHTSMLNLERQLIDAKIKANPLSGSNSPAPTANSYEPLITKATQCIKEIGTSFSYFQRAKAYVEQGKTSAAFADFAKALSLAKTESSPVASPYEILRERAELHVRLVDRKSAKADLSEALRLAPREQRVISDLANLDNRIAEANEKRAIADPQTAEDYVIVGNDLFTHQKSVEAIRAFDRSLSLKPSVAAYVGKTRALQSLSRFSEALVEINKALALAANNKDAVLLRGHVYASLSRLDEAIADYTTALTSADPQTKPTILTSRGEAYRKKGSFELAIKDLDAAIAAAVAANNVYSKIEALNAKAEVYRQQGKVADALTIYQTAITTAGDDYIAKIYLIDTYLRRAKIYAGQGKTDLAKADLISLLKISPKSEEAKAEVAKLNGTANGPTSAKTARQWAAEGQRAGAARKFDEAVKAFSECIRLEPAKFECYAFRGAMLGLNGSLAGSQADFEKALKLGNNNPGIYFMRSQMYVQLGKKPEAIADLRQVLKLAPGNAQAIKALEQLGVKP